MKKCIFALLLFGSASLFAQPISIGVKGGVPMNSVFDTSGDATQKYTSDTKRYLFGPTAEFHLPLGFSFEVDALYRRQGFNYNAFGPNGNLATSYGTTANQWEFPFLLKWQIPAGPIRPFVDTGVAFRHITGIKQVAQTYDAAGNVTSKTSSTNTAELNARNSAGYVIGGGVNFKFGRLNVAPELRYTRWGDEPFRGIDQSLLKTSLNQGDFLIGITF